MVFLDPITLTDGFPTSKDVRVYDLGNVKNLILDPNVDETKRLNGNIQDVYQGFIGKFLDSVE